MPIRVFAPQQAVERPQNGNASLLIMRYDQQTTVAGFKAAALGGGYQLVHLNGCHMFSVVHELATLYKWG